MYNNRDEPPPFPWFIVIGIIFLVIWTSNNAKNTMEKMNSGAADFIVFNSSGNILDIFGITENEFIGINTKKELKQKKRALKKGEYAFIKYNGFILQTSKIPFKNNWNVNTSIGVFICDSPPNGFIVSQGTVLEAIAKPNKIEATIYAIVPKSGKMNVYKMEKIAGSEMEINNHGEENYEVVSDENVFGDNRFMRIIMGYSVLFCFTGLLLIILLIINFFLNNRILIPLFLLNLFIVIACLSFLLVIFQIITNIYIHNFNFGTIISQVVVIICAIFCLRTVDMYKKVFY